MMFSLPFGNGKDLFAERKKTKIKKIASMLSFDCVDEILIPLKSTVMLTFISAWTGN